MSAICEAHEWQHIRRVHIPEADGTVAYFDVFYCVWCLEYRRTTVPWDMMDHWKPRA